MIHNHFILSIRNLNKRLVYSLINILGLGIGIAVSLVIIRYVDFELSYDRHHTNGPSIYRTILTRYLNNEFRDVTGLTGYGTGPALLADIPEVKSIARAHYLYGGAVLSSQVGGPHSRTFREERAYAVDPAFLNMFTFQVLAGDLQTALNNPDNILITRSIAEKYFGGVDVLGKSLSVTGAWLKRDLTVSAIVEDQPENTTIVFDFLLPLSDLLKEQLYVDDDGWGWKNFNTYVQLHPGADINSVIAKMPVFISKYVKGKLDLTFQPLFEIHTQTGMAFDPSDRISKSRIYFFVLIAIFILCIAWINYVNLATARAMERAREVSIKKVIGARKRQLIIQFLMESGVLNLLAVAFGLCTAIALLPMLAEIVGKQFTFDFSDGRLWFLLGCFVVGGGFISGIYPAFVLSSFPVATVLKSPTAQSSRTFFLRHSLVIFQFACTLILICMTYVVSRQITFMEEQVQDLNMDRMLIVKAPYVIENDAQHQKLLTFKQQLLALTSVEKVSSSAGIPGGGYSYTTGMIKKGDAAENRKIGNVVLVDPDFIETYDIQMISGKPWDAQAVSYGKSLIINEVALTMFQIPTAAEALNHRIVLENDTFDITGVMKNYSWRSLKAANEPILLIPQKVVMHSFSIHLHEKSYQQPIGQIEALFKAAFPGNPFEYYFLDDFFESQYKEEHSFQKIFSMFSSFAIVIACLGLLGFTAFTTAKKEKEFGIRKVLGATAGNIVSLLMKDLLTIIALASLVCVPVMWYTTHSWLTSFANRINLSWDIFVIPILMLTIICMLTVIIHILSAAATNPAKILKSE